jgi:hypothetical protein
LSALPYPRQKKKHRKETYPVRKNVRQKTLAKKTNTEKYGQKGSAGKKRQNAEKSTAPVLETYSSTSLFPKKYISKENTEKKCMAPLLETNSSTFPFFERKYSKKCSVENNI